MTATSAQATRPPRGAAGPPFAAWLRTLAGLRVPLLFLLPAGAIVIVFVLWPVVNTLFLSLTNLATSNFGNPDFVGLDNYRFIFENRWTPRILGNTVLYVTVTLLLFNLGLALVIAVSTTFVPRGVSDAVRAFWLLPRITSPVVYVLIWQAVTAPAPFGILSDITAIDQNWLREHPWATIVTANGLIGASFGMLVLSSAIRAIPLDHFRAAAVDGASQWTLISRIILPQIRWPILFVTVYQALSLLTSFEYILLLTNGGPGFYETEVWSLWAYKEAFQSYAGAARFGLGTAISTGLVVIGLGVSLLILKLFRFRELLGQPKIEVN